MAIHFSEAELAEPEMVFFIHIIQMDSESGWTMTLPQTVRVTEGGVEAPNRAPLDLVVSGTRAPSRG